MNKKFLVGNAHIDPVWLWKLPEGLSEILATFRSALDRMNEFDGYIFTSACASYYKWVEETDPAMFEEIRTRINEGRWVIAGGMWVQPDCNLPSGEAFARHLLYSQRYFKEKFGRIASFGYNVDSFGHNGMLPQLFNKADIHEYVMMRPSREEKPNLTESLFLWESPDGSRVTVYRIPFSYGDGGRNFPDFTRYNELIEEQKHPLMVFYGVGNHGGGPSIRALETAETLIGDEVRYASPDRYFDYIRTLNLDLPIVREDLQHHASGCYAANANIKKLNQRAENILVTAERYNLLSGHLTDCPSLQGKLQTAWETVLFNQFHDILAGCSIREAYDDAEAALGSAINTAFNVRVKSLQSISWNINTSRGLSNAPTQKDGWDLWSKNGEGAPFVVFNPHSFPVKRLVKINTPQISGICDANGKPVPFQSVRGPQTNGLSRENIAFMAEIAPLGYSTYYIYKDEVFDAPVNNPTKAEGNVLENRFLRAEFDSATGTIVSLMDKASGKVINSAPLARPLVIDDTKPDTWAHNLFTFDQIVGEFGSADIVVTENGPLRATIRVTSRYGNSVLRQDFSLCADSKAIEVKCLLNFNEQLKLVKLAFPVATEDNTDTKAIYSMPYGFIEKVTNGEEEPAQRWAAVSTSDKGVAVASDCKHSFSVKGGELRMNIARGCIYADHYGVRDDMVEYQDQGEQLFRYAICPYEEISVHEIVKEAALINQPLDVIPETHHKGKLPNCGTGISVSTDNVLLEALKHSENDSGFVARFYETDGITTTAEVTVLGKKTTLTFAPQEIKTVLFADNGDICEILLTELG